MWPHLFISIMINNAAGVYVLFAPSIITSFGFEALRANALASVGSWLSMICVIGSGFLAYVEHHREDSLLRECADKITETGGVVVDSWFYARRLSPGSLS